MFGLNLSRFVLGQRRRLNGAHRDKPDSRDKLIRLATLDDAIPSAATVDRGQPPEDQDGTGSCVGQSVTSAIWLAYMANGIDCPDLSALFAYYNGRRYHQTTVTDNGTGIRYVIKGSVRFGATTEDAWPFKPAAVNRKPGWNAYRLGHDRRGVRGYYRIPRGDLNAVRRAIANKLPVVAWWVVDKAFTSRTGPSVIGPCDESKRAGNHCMVIPSYYEKGEFGLLNSWGAWRHNGRQRVTAEFVARGRDLWAIDVRP
jgi:hypothetical protein